METDGHQDPDTEPGTSEYLLLTSLALGESPGLPHIGVLRVWAKSFCPFFETFSARRKEEFSQNDVGI